MRELLEIWVELSWMLLKRLGKGMFELIQKDTYSCMIHVLLMSINLQVFYQDLSFIHVLMLNVTLLCLTGIG